MKENFTKIVTTALQEIKERGVDIGEGRTAVVSIIPGGEDICLKTIKDKTISANRAHAEMRFLNELSKGNLIAPRPICSIETDEFDFIFMEAINGFSVKDLIEKNLFDRLPIGFDSKLFLTALQKIIEGLHEQRIYHRDLHSGNIMINLEQPNDPVVIDFGDAARQFLSSEDPYREKVRGKSIVFPDDLEKLRELRLELGQYLKMKGVRI